MSSVTTSPAPVPTPYSLYCRKRSRIGASAALVMQWYQGPYQVSWDAEDVDVDSPALLDPETDETIHGIEIVAYLLHKLDTDKKRCYEAGSLEAEVVKIRIDRMLNQVETGNPIQFAFDLETYIREELNMRVVGRTTTLADFLFFPVSFGIFYHFQRRRTRLFYRTAAWYAAWTRDPRTRNALFSVGWGAGDDAFADIVLRNSS
ncbi:hypothetical protein BJY00DRAFT_313025 [Aspergillus carlsbadensis]|nr:hypothetical protein BJY00DRAFT_313025 [Aspergillus carlsbadensis]